MTKATEFILLSQTGPNEEFTSDDLVFIKSPHDKSKRFGGILAAVEKFFTPTFAW